MRVGSAKSAFSRGQSRSDERRGGRRGRVEVRRSAIARNGDARKGDRGKISRQAALRPIRESFARGRTCCAATARPADLLDANERAAARRSVPAVMADMAPTLRVCAGRVWRERVERARKAGLSKKRVWTLESRVRRPATGRPDNISIWHLMIKHCKFTERSYSQPSVVVARARHSYDVPHFTSQMRSFITSRRDFRPCRVRVTVRGCPEHPAPWGRGRSCLRARAPVCRSCGRCLPHP